MKITKPIFLFLLCAGLGNIGFVFPDESDVPEFVNTNSEPILYCSDPVAVAPNISIQNIQIDEADEGVKISISNYIEGEDVLEYDTLGAFRYYWDSNAGSLEITGVGSDEAYEKAVSQVYYRNTSSTPTVGIRLFSISLRDADYLPFSADSGHFYRYVSHEKISWKDANAAADTMTYYGLQGYLATIRSEEEQEFIYLKTLGTGWIGGSDEAEEGTWEWVTGPDKGINFWKGSSGGTAVGGEYSHWDPGEPNNQGDEDYAHILYSAGERGAWNDLPNEGSSFKGYVPQGFLVEFGGMPGDPDLKLSAAAEIEIRDSEHPMLDTTVFKSLFCGTTSATLQLAFTNGSPETKLSALDPEVEVRNTTTEKPEVTVPAFGSYDFQLDMTDDAGCPYIDTIKLEFHNQPDASFTLDEEECAGYNLQLTFPGATEEEADFTWFYNGNVFRSGTELTSVTIPLGFEVMERTVGLLVNEQGCIDSSSKVVTGEPNVILSAEDTVGCSPQVVNFKASTEKLRPTYFWGFSDGQFSNDQNPSHTFKNGSDTVLFFDVQLTVTAVNGCENTAVYPDFVQVFPVPVAGFDLNSHEVLITDPEVTFTNTSHAATSYAWDFGDGSFIVEEIDPVHRYDSMNVYSVLLEAKNDWGCVDSISKELTVTFDKLFPPNAFSPNASLEEDREFRLYGEGVSDVGYRLIIFDSWGGKVFESTTQNKGWKGKMKNSKFAPAGVYSWVLHYTDFTGKAHKQSGTVSLLF